MTAAFDNAGFDNAPLDNGAGSRLYLDRGFAAQALCRNVENANFYRRTT